MKQWEFPITEPGIDIYLNGIVRKRGSPTTEMIMLALSPKELAKDDSVPNWAEPLLDDVTIVALPRGCKEWTEKSPPNYVERAHALLGMTVDQGRVRDIIASIRMFQEQAKADDPQKKQTWKVIGKGPTGIIAAYAALFQPSITEVVIVDPPVSHRHGPIFLNVLRVLDIPDALGLLAPRALTLVNAKDKAFDRTAQIYKLAGAESKFQRK
jgi:hypothetical protein